MWSVINRAPMVHIHTHTGLKEGQITRPDHHPTSVALYALFFPPPTINTVLLLHLWRCRSIPVAGEDLQRDPSAAVFQHLLQLCGVVPNILAIHLFDDVTHVEQSLPVYHAAMENPGDDQVIFFYAKSHTLPGR